MAKVILDQIYRRISGRIDSSTAVNTFNGGQSLLRGFTTPQNPQTTEQLTVRSIFSQLTKAWGQTLTEPQRAGWNAFAAVNPVTNNLGNSVTRTGLSAFVELGTIQMLRTGSYIAAAPTLGRPSPITAIPAVTTASPNPGDLAIELSHGYVTLTGLYVMVKQTPILTSPAITPKASEYRLIEGAVATSFQSLQASGSTYGFDDPRYTDDTGFRGGFSAQIVNAEGYASLPFRAVIDAAP